MSDEKSTFTKTALGGTFSFFHVGHKHLIKTALELSNEVIIGVVSDEYASIRRKSHPIEPYEVRALRVLRYCLRKAKRGQRITVFPLDTAEGPASYDPSIEALVATEETLVNALKINNERVARKLKPLVIRVVEPILDDNGKPISSTKLWTSYLLNSH